jgi:NAD-dependent DNA ligase
MARVNAFSDLAVVAQVMDLPQVLANKNVAISGHLGRPRDEIVKLIEAAGGRYHSTVKFDTNYLLTNADWTNTLGKTSSKYAKAARNGVRIISESKFYEMLCI